MFGRVLFPSVLFALRLVPHVVSLFFATTVENALKTVATILEAERHPVLAADEPHEYADKYALAEYLTNTAVASQMNALTALGLQPSQLKTISEWVLQKKKSVTLRFLAEDACSFLKEEDVEVQHPGGGHEVITTKTEKGSGGFFGSGSGGTKEETTTTRVVQRVKEFHWKVGVRYKLIVFPGTAVDEALVLQQRSSETVLITQLPPGQGSKLKAPLPEHTLHPPVDASLTWFVRMISPDDQTCQFTIDRSAKKCKTPRRNDNVQEAVDFHKQLYDWARITQGFFLQRIEKELQGKDNPVRPRPPPAAKSSILEPGATGTMQGLMKEPTFNGKAIRIVEYSREQQRYKAEPVDPNSGLPPTLSIKPANIKPDRMPSSSPAAGPPLSTISDEGIFCSILPLMENGSVLSMQDAGDFLQEQMRSMDEALEGLAREYPPKNLVKIVSVAEAGLVLLCKHVEHLALQYQDSVNYVEDMLKQQLIQAVGKEIGHSDFEQFMRFYNKKFFGMNFAPTPFSHAIRRPGHYPDGIISIEATTLSSSSPKTPRGTVDTSTSDPIETWVRSIAAKDSPSIFIPINAAASVEITGNRFLHGWMQHRFKAKQKPDYQLACRARQFSCFLVVLGTIAGPDKFEPKDAIILQNKDELLIPLATTVLPSAKEFKDAIKSLSPEQQDFAKAYRAMQLESSVFGVCVIQLKPQLEKLLGLPEGALTKEIQLTQELMSLFVDYQVPSDLLTFEGRQDCTQVEKVDAVKGYVKSVLDVIDESKKKQLKEEEMKADMRAEMDYHPPAQPLVIPEAADRSDRMNDGSETSKRSGRGRGMYRKSAAPFGGPSLMAEAVMGQSTPDSSFAMVSSMMGGAPATRSAAPMSASQSPKRTALSPSSVQPPYKLPPQDITPSGGRSPGNTEDFTMIPKELDAKLEKHDKDNALRSTIIKPGSHWARTRQENFLTGAKTSTLSPDTIASEKKKAFDLLDAISRSGTLAIDCSELHVVVAVSHCFDNDIMGTVVQDNVNPIEKLERSSLMLASTIYGQPAVKLIQNEQDAERLRGTFPLLLESESSSAST